MRAVLLCAMVLILSATAGCNDGKNTLYVFAASSLSDVFRNIGTEFEAANPDIVLRFNFASSSSLAAQILEGAPANVFISANSFHAERVTLTESTSAPIVFAHNSMVIVTPADSEDTIMEFADLAVPGLLLVMAAPEVPAGAYAREILSRANTAEEFGLGFKESVLANTISNELNVRSALAKVQLREAEAAIVYYTDALSVGDDVRIVEIPESLNLITDYFIVLTDNNQYNPAANPFIDFVTSERGRIILARHGFIVAASSET